MLEAIPEDFLDGGLDDGLFDGAIEGMLDFMSDLFDGASEGGVDGFFDGALEGLLDDISNLVGECDGIFILNKNSSDSSNPSSPPPFRMETMVSFWSRLKTV